MEDQEVSKCRPCIYMSVQLLGLHISLVFDQIFGLAYLGSSDDRGDVRLGLTGLHLGIRGNFDLNEILIELYGEDLKFKET